MTSLPQNSFLRFVNYELMEYLKGGTLMTFIAWFLGGLGVDRFMLGDTGLGIAKLLTCGGCGIWTIIDIFTAGSRTRKYNAQKVLSSI